MNETIESSNTNECDGCKEYVGLSRRSILGTAGTIFASAGLTAFAGAVPASAANGSVLVVLSLRGGVDSLSLVVPHGDPAYFKARPTIAVPRDQLWAGDGFFGLSPGLEPLRRLWNEKKVAFVTACGIGEANRSHFHAMAELEASGTDPARSGWIGRMTGSTALANSLAGVSLTGGQPISFNGSTNVANAENVNDLRLVGTEDGRTVGFAQARREQISTMWDRAPSNHPFRSAAKEALSIGQTLRTLPGGPPANGAVYDGGLGYKFSQLAQLIKSDIPMSVAHLETIGWDTHTAMGDKASTLNRSYWSVSKNIDALFTDLGPLADRVTLVTISEFGRRTFENASRGTDHGWGNTVTIVGAGVNGGRVYGRWPGLGTGDDDDSDLKVTTDYRHVLHEVISRRFPTVSMPSIFPGLSPIALGVMK